ncbi:MAG: hypothetical protein Ct9H300mP11_00650 [Chloroflexota bacterium]|nr:MAG: hypothetical protein Ct9H300mP11_00650 [Chloroflexota bacterium]
MHIVQCETVLEWAFEQGDRVFFPPDQHLGRNTALEMGIQLMRWLSGTRSDIGW